jgi:CBS domain-containing protein
MRVQRLRETLFSPKEAAMTTSPLGALSVADVMHAGLVTCAPETSLRGVARILAAHRIHAVVVADGRGRDPARIHGVVSDLDLLEAMLGPSGVETAGAAVGSPARFVGSGATVLDAARAMVAHRVSHLLVVDEELGDVAGVISTLDVAEALS